MARNTHVVFDGYSYEPPSYEEAQSIASANQSVYKPTVSQNPNTNLGGFRPLYTPNGYNGLTEYNLAKRRRRMRIAAATALGVFCFIALLAILFWNISSAYYVSHKYKSYVEKSNEDFTPYQPYKDSSVFNNDDYYREPVNDNKQIEDSHDDVLDKTEDKTKDKTEGKIQDKVEDKTEIKGQSEDEWERSLVNEAIFAGSDLKTIANKMLEREQEKWNRNKDSDRVNIDSMLNNELEKLKTQNSGESTDINGRYDRFLDTHLRNEFEKLNIPYPGFLRNPTSTADKAVVNTSTGKSLGEVVKIPDLLISHTGDIDVDKAYDLLKSLHVNHNDKK